MVSFHGLMLGSALELESALAFVWVSDWVSGCWSVHTKAPVGTSGAGCPDRQMIPMNVDLCLPWSCRKLTVHLPVHAIDIDECGFLFFPFCSLWVSDVFLFVMPIIFAP
jgi:hypothetical protein